MGKFDKYVEFEPLFVTIRELQEITPNEKVLLSTIIGFRINDKLCKATNGWFATRMGVKKNSVSTMIKHLTELEYITCYSKYDSEAQIKRRYIDITFKTRNLITKKNGIAGKSSLEKEQYPSFDGEESSSLDDFLNELEGESKE